MSKNLFRSFNLHMRLAMLCAALWVTACTKGELNLAIADAPVDEAEAVVVEIAGVEFQPVDGSSETVTFSTPKQINLLNYANGDSASLLTGELLEVGDYSWLRLIVNAETGVRDSYVTVNGAEFELTIPADALSGLTINRAFKITRAETSSLTIDVDLRKSLLKPLTGETEYRLRPTLRWVDNAKQGTLTGVVDPAVIANECGAGDQAAVYLFSADVTQPDDVDGITPDPITTAMVKQDGINAYTAAFLEPGSYVAAFTCDAAKDQPDTDDADVVFTGKATVSISAGETTTHDFVP